MAPSNMPPPVIIFIHVQKTAGTSFRQWLTEFFDGNVLFHSQRRSNRPSQAEDLIENRGYEANGATVCDLKQLFRESGAAGFKGYRAIGGHCTFDYSFISAIDAPKLICSAVRDPVDRIASLYNWARLHKGNPMHDCVEGRTLFQSLQRKGRFYRESNNKQLNCIFGKKRGIFSRRRSNTLWTMVSRHDRYDFLMQKIADMYGKSVGEFPHRNRSRVPYRHELNAQPDFEDAVRLIRKLNSEEVEFVDSVGDFVELNPQRTM